mmetsp:Transcript_3431/g.5115  ORF Transcript_3431/g.5115 Transcript_3431/m.5115 type:complete len:205 (-) Transcript_3431:377-991(-)
MSSKGLLIAAIAAFAARFLPTPVPTPINAVPASLITVFTSAKSTFTMPVFNIISDIPRTPWRRISSATRNASITGVLSGTILKSLSFDTTISVSTCFFKFVIASSACFIRCLPSNPNGLVTTPTVRHPFALATSATTGAAPLPVPPPIPAVMNIMSLPFTIASISSLDSIAASYPTLGLPPAPNPFVNLRPIFSLSLANDVANA